MQLYNLRLELKKYVKYYLSSSLLGVIHKKWRGSKNVISSCLKMTKKRLQYETGKVKSIISYLE